MAAAAWTLHFLFGASVQRLLEPGCTLALNPLLVGSHSLLVKLLNMIRPSDWVPDAHYKRWLVTEVNPLRGQHHLFTHVHGTRFAVTQDISKYTHKQFHALVHTLQATRFPRPDGDVPYRHVLLCYARKAPPIRTRGLTCRLYL